MTLTERLDTTDRRPCDVCGRPENDHPRGWVHPYEPQRGGVDALLASGEVRARYFEPEWVRRSRERQAELGRVAERELA